MKIDQDLYELAQHLEKIKGKETTFSGGFSGRFINTKKRIDDPWPEVLCMGLFFLSQERFPHIACF